MSEIGRAVGLEEFEQVDATATTGLLRVAVKPGAAGGDDAPAALLVSAGTDVRRLSALPAPPTQDGLLRAAFPAPAKLLATATSFRLELSSGNTLELPKPARRPVGAKVRAPAAPPPRGVDLELERTIGELRGARTVLEREVASQRQQITELLAERGEAHAELAQLERRHEQELADLRAELDEARAQNTRTLAHVEAQRRALADIQVDHAAELDGLQERQEEELQATRAQLSELEAMLDASEQSRAHTIAELRAEGLRHAAESERAEAEVESLRANLARASERATELEGTLVTLEAQQAAEAELHRAALEGQAEALREEQARALEELTGEREAIHGELTAAREAHDQLEAELNTTRTELGRAHAELREAQGELTQALETAESGANAAEQRLAVVRRELDEIADALGASEQGRTAAQAELEAAALRHQAELQALQEQLAEAERTRHELEQRGVTELEAVRTQQQRQIEQLEGELAQVREDRDRIRSESEDLRLRVEALDSELESARRVAEESAQELERAVAGHASQLELVQAEWGLQLGELRGQMTELELMAAASEQGRTEAQAQLSTADALHTAAIEEIEVRHREALAGLERQLSELEQTLATVEEGHRQARAESARQLEELEQLRESKERELAELSEQLAALAEQRRSEASGDVPARVSPTAPLAPVAEAEASRTSTGDLAPHIEQGIIAFSLAHPSFGPRRISTELARESGISASEHDVWRVLRRAGLNTRAKRMASIATDPQPGQAASRRVSARESDDAPARPGELVQIDSTQVARLSGSQGSVWQYTAVDVASGYAWAALHTSTRTPRARHCQPLLERIAGDLSLGGWQLGTVSTDTGSEFVSTDFHDAVEALGARQRRVKAGRASGNHEVEQVQLTILDECWRPTFGRSVMPNLAGMQEELSSYLTRYNSDPARASAAGGGERTPAEILYGEQEINAAT